MSAWQGLIAKISILSGPATRTRGSCPRGANPDVCGTLVSKGCPVLLYRRGQATIVRCMTKWEYVTVPLLTHATKQILDNWGDEGYELVAVLPGPNTEQLVAYMKRPKS